MQDGGKNGEHLVYEKFGYKSDFGFSNKEIIYDLENYIFNENWELSADDRGLKSKWKQKKCDNRYRQTPSYYSNLKNIILELSYYY